MSAQVWNLWQQEWLYGELVNFDGDNRKIYVHPEQSLISVKKHIYSGWKRWVQLQNNAAFPPAMRTSGGDPIGPGVYAGDIYFLINDWQVVIDHYVKMDGIIYSDNPELDPFIITSGGGIFATVSSLSQSIESVVPIVTGDVSQIPAAMAEIVTKTDAVAAAVAAQTISVDATNAALAVTQTTLEETKTQVTQIAGQTEWLTPTQATMLLEMYQLLGLDPAIPLVVTQTTRSAGPITQGIVMNTATQTTTVSRQ